MYVDQHDPFRQDEDKAERVKRILYFFPLNPADRNSGSNTRALGLLRYFKDRGYEVDFISKRIWGQWTDASRQRFEDLGLAEKVFIFSKKPPKKNPVTYFFTYKLWHQLFKRKLHRDRPALPNQVTLFLRQQLDEVLKKKHYDYFIVSYSYWADFVKDNQHVKNTITILDTHDFLPSQHQKDEQFDLGTAIRDEISRLKQYDQVWAISPDEVYFYSQFLQEKVKYVPLVIDEPAIPSVVFSKKYDLVYVATNNPHNIRSLDWFLKKVYPLLPKEISLAIVGTITAHVEDSFPGITLIPFAEDLSELYYSSGIAICPMLSGTGVKVKVVEALAHGLPVVCTERGIDGLPLRMNNGCVVTNDPNEFANAILDLLKDREKYNAVSKAGLNLYAQCFSPKAVYGMLDKIFQEKKSSPAEEPGKP